MPNLPAEVTGYVLAGGRSSRMGRDKTLLPIAEMPMVEHALTRLRRVCANVAILSGPKNAERDAVLGRYARTISDTDATHSGPLAGICAALCDCKTNYALILPVDQPNISVHVLRSLLTVVKQQEASGACFVLGSEPQPLPLLLGHDLRTGILNVFASGERRLLPGVVSGAAAQGRVFLKLPFSGTEHAFENLNTPDDLKRWSARDTASNQSAPHASEQ